jgi:dephospho-CoA kinase
VDGFLERLGAIVIDADVLVHELLSPGTGEHRQVVARFGDGILNAAGRIERRTLGALVFADAAARADLNAILHPAVRRQEAARKDELRGRGGGIVVTDAALLVETGRHTAYDRLVVVACDPALQLARLLARDDGLTPAEARQRLAAQAPVADKLAVADYVIETSGSLAETERQAQRLYQRLVEDLESKRRGEPLPPRREGT